MVISDNPPCAKFPGFVDSIQERFDWLSGGYVTVGRYSMLREKDIVDYYMPRIRGITFKYKGARRGAKTPDLAYKYGCRLLKEFRSKSRQNKDGQ